MKTFTLSFILLCISSIFIYSHQFTDPYIVPKWLSALFVGLCTTIYWSIRTLSGQKIKVNVTLLGLSIVAICFLEAIYGISQYFTLSVSHSIHKVTGSFDNPAGFAVCLSCGLPFVGFLLANRNKYIRYSGLSAGIIIIAAIILSHSRAGIISVAVICAAFLYQQLVCKRKLYLLLGSLLLLLIGCYWMKKDSADGRLLIWQCSMNMVKESPWLGHGMGSFEAHYMDYQAEYFRTHGQENRYAMLADNVKQPFNEYLGILLNYGIIGLSILIAIVALLFHCYKKKKSIEKKIAAYSLLSIGIFALFSYPFTYPFVWIITLLCIFILSGEYLTYFSSIIWFRNIVCICILGCSLAGIYKLAARTQAEKEWGKASILTCCHSYDKALPMYKQLKNTFDDNPYFLYNYAAILQENKQYMESLQVALQCRQYWADYDLELMIGELYQQFNEPEPAEKYYRNASMMCPSRFTPLYKLFYLYKEQGENRQMIDIANIIVNKPMKVKTSTILMMKRTIKKEITNTKNMKGQ